MRRHGNPDGPRLLISHGNGLAIDLYYPFWGALLQEFDVVVFDLRNHGWNRVGDTYGHNVPQFAKDLDRMQAAATQRFGKKPTIGVYHSLSALAVSVSETRGAAYAGLFLLDPPFCKPGHTYAEFDAAVEALASGVRGRSSASLRRGEGLDGAFACPAWMRRAPFPWRPCLVPSAVCGTTVQPAARQSSSERVTSLQPDPPGGYPEFAAFATADRRPRPCRPCPSCR